MVYDENEWDQDIEDDHSTCYIIGWYLLLRIIISLMAVAAIIHFTNALK